MREGLTERMWVRDIMHALTVHILLQFLNVWDLLHHWSLSLGSKQICLEMVSR